MGKPAIVAVDDDPVVASAITRDVRSRYSDYYRVVRATSGREALEVPASLALRDQPVALIITDQRMPEMTGMEMRYRSEVVAGSGNGHLERLTLADRDSGATEEVPASWLFIFVGASPGTEWLGPDVARDGKAFVVTGRDLFSPGLATQWPLARAPFALETSVPGVFAAGDVRLDSVKRVASAVGEGGMSVYFVHRYLATV
jgi:thioredoxin reductase